MFTPSAATRIGSVLALLLLGGCATLPNGPSVLVLPGSGKTFDQFRFDEQNCRSFALAQIGGTPQSQAAVNAGVASAAIGTAVGAAAGAAIGGGTGAGIGAGSGLVLGSLLGTGFGQDAYGRAQQQYDFAFQQCMYANGHRVPVAGVFPQQAPRAPAAMSAPPPAAVTTPSPQAGTIPPPPPGAPPAPPPR
jgi:hypothetical protein